MLKETAPMRTLRGKRMTTLSMVIPALNERENIDRLFEEIPFAALAAQGWETEILVVDNGSTDGTARAARGRRCPGPRPAHPRVRKRLQARLRQRRRRRLRHRGRRPDVPLRHASSATALF